jgi:hypothetical protein
MKTHHQLVQELAYTTRKGMERVLGETLSVPGQMKLKAKRLVQHVHYDTKYGL